MHSDFYQTLKNENPQQDDRVTTNFRISQIDLNIMSALAEELNITKQELFDSLIKNYVRTAWESALNEKNVDIQDDHDIDQTRVFLLNTNNTHSIQDIDYMLQRNENGVITRARATLFEKNYIDKINRIHEGDIVCLYESGKGIIGFGVAHGKPIDEVDPQKYNHKLIRYIELKDYSELNKPISAKKLRAILNTNPPFLQAMSKLSGNIEKLQSELNLASK